jgi:hypothetical protein
MQAKEDVHGYRAEFIRLVRRAMAIAFYPPMKSLFRPYRALWKAYP